MDTIRKLEEQKLEYTRLKREKESHERDSTQKGTKIKTLSEQESKNKEVEIEIRKELEDLAESYKSEVGISDILREELLHSREREEEVRQSHYEEVTHLGKETVKHQLEKDELSTRVHDIGIALKTAEAKSGIPKNSLKWQPQRQKQ